ncbi:hypothetical protein [Actinocatenispora thailandica]|uniref:hypothetical protein n=1 Tax=Actinocatenispora thailandica TaxID=227318 RepID=UPI0019502122|nr:hypothetical protein [Actinocatenispora thailandica]
MLLAGCSADPLGHLDSRATLVNDLAAQLDHGQTRSYSADYRLSDGSRATLAQQGDPHRIAYIFSSGRYVRLVLSVLRCGDTSCTLSTRPPNNYQQPPDADAVGTASDHRFLTAQQMLGLIQAAGETPGSTIAGTTRTIAGQRSRCVRVRSGGDAFTACLTLSGAPASFRGVAGGHRYEFSLTGWRDQVVGRPFSVPHGVRVVDERTSPTPR